MSEEIKNRLYKAAETGVFEDMQAEFEECDDFERKKYGKEALWRAAGNEGSDALKMVKYLIEYPDGSVGQVNPDSYTLCCAAGNAGPDAFHIAEYLIEIGVKPDSETLGLAVQNMGDSCALDIVELLIEEGVEPNGETLWLALENVGPHTYSIVKLLMKQGTGIEDGMFYFAAGNTGPCALDIVKLLVERGLDIHWKNDEEGSTAFTQAIDSKNFAVVDYLFSRDDFRLSDLMPCPVYPSGNTCKTPAYLSDAVYKEYRDKAISRAIELVDEKGLPYARTIAADIEKILKTEEPEPTQGDIKVLQLLVNKIVSKDWVADTQVSSDDFLGYDVER